MHSVCESTKNCFVVFGGERISNSDTIKRIVFNDLYEFNMDTLTWRAIEPDLSLMPSRRAHAACVVGKYLIV